MKKPTLKQLKKRPALWHWNGAFSLLMISYPEDKNEYYQSIDAGGGYWNTARTKHEYMLGTDQIEFLGWL